MAEFVFMTMSDRTTTYDGPSGERYVININMPFKVTNKDDIEFFDKNPRFQKVGVFTKKPEPEPTDDEKLRIELSKVKGLTKKTIEKVVDFYRSKSNLTFEIEQGYKLDSSISKRQAKLIEKYILKGDK